MSSVTLTHLKNLKQRGEEITMLTCYDATFAHELSTAGVEMLPIGDTLGMILQGHDSTLPVRLEDMVYQTACVKRGNNGGFIIADRSFITCSSPVQGRDSHQAATLVDTAKKLEEAGAASMNTHNRSIDWRYNMVKILPCTKDMHL